MSRGFKVCFYEHKADMRKSESRTKSSLSAHVWDLKDRGTNFKVRWRIKERSTAYNSTTSKYTICLKEKLHILDKTEGATLNKRSEIFNLCRHRTKNIVKT